jgi:hypothetical protein
MKESYENMKILNYLQHNEYCSNICGDVKVMGLLLGMQLGNVKFGFLLYECDSHSRSSHCAVREWPCCKEFLPGKKKIGDDPLVDSEKIFIPPLHIKV